MPGSGWTGAWRGSGAASSGRPITSSGSSRWVGAGLLGLGDLERLAHDLGHDLRARNACVPLNDRAHDADQIDVLV